MPRIEEQHQHSAPVFPDPANPNPASIARQLIMTSREIWTRVRRLEERVAELEKTVEDHATFIDG